MRAIDQGIQFGVYIAKSRGKYIMDEDKNLLNIASRRGDESRIRELVRVAQSFGLDEITVEWREGARQIDDEEFERQVERMNSGLVPDELDAGEHQEWLRQQRLKKQGLWLPGGDR